MRRLLTILVLTVVFAAAPGQAAIEAYQFDNPRNEERFHDLAEELRCLVCQNQSIAESNADLAKDLRREVYEMIQQGKRDEEIVEFLVARYGDFVRYRPPVKPSTYLLWAGPIVLLIVGLIILAVVVRRRAAEHADDALSEEERRRLEGVLKGTGEEQR